MKRQLLAGVLVALVSAGAVAVAARGEDCRLRTPCDTYACTAGMGQCDSTVHRKSNNLTPGLFLYTSQLTPCGTHFPWDASAGVCTLTTDGSCGGFRVAPSC